jgi:hypothetical protein
LERNSNALRTAEGESLLQNVGQSFRTGPEVEAEERSLKMVVATTLNVRTKIPPPPHTHTHNYTHTRTDTQTPNIILPCARGEFYACRRRRRLPTALSKKGQCHKHLQTLFTNCKYRVAKSGDNKHIYTSILLSRLTRFEGHYIFLLAR